MAAAERRAEPKVADLQDVRASSALRARVEYVFGFQVPVRDLVAVAVADRLDHLCERDARLALRVMILRRDPVEEFAAAAVLDDHAKLLLVQVAVVQPADVRVVDAAHRPDLDRELRDRPRVGVAEVDDLDRADVASVRARERDKNGAEAPLAQLPSNHVVALDGLQPEVVRGMRREKFEPTQAVVDGRAADDPSRRHRGGERAAVANLGEGIVERICALALMTDRPPLRATSRLRMGFFMTAAITCVVGSVADDAWPSGW